MMPQIIAFISIMSSARDKVLRRHSELKRQGERHSAKIKQIMRVKLNHSSANTEEVYLPLIQFITPRSESVITLDLSNCSLKSLEFLRYAHWQQVKNLNLSNNHLVNLRGLEKCNTPQLEMLYLRFNHIKENQPFHTFCIPRIVFIYLNDNRIASLSNLEKLRYSCRRLDSVYVTSNLMMRSSCRTYKLRF